eukprot:1006749-Prymnesium_polylepis.1
MDMAPGHGTPHQTHSPHRRRGTRDRQRLHDLTQTTHPHPDTAKAQTTARVCNLATVKSCSKAAACAASMPPYPPKFHARFDAALPTSMASKRKTRAALKFCASMCWTGSESRLQCHACSPSDRGR